jgi:hypothetical protein
MGQRHIIGDALFWLFSSTTNRGQSRRFVPRLSDVPGKAAFTEVAFASNATLYYIIQSILSAGLPIVGSAGEHAEAVRLLKS